MPDLHLAGMVVDCAGSGMPVIFVHGLGGTSNTFTPLQAAYAEGYRCYCPDLPGSGRSPLPASGRLSIEAMADAVLALADAEDRREFHLVGHSLGTIVCQHVAARAPERVVSMVLLGALTAPPDAARDGLRRRAADARANGMAGIADAICRGAVAQAARTENPTAIAAVRESLMRQPPEGYAATCEALAEARAAEVAGLEVPTLLLTGAEDAVAPPDVARGLADRMRQARAVILPRCGHWPSFERPGEVVRELRHFYRRH